MIIDSHAHYNNGTDRKPFRYLTYGEVGYASGRVTGNSFSGNWWRPISHTQSSRG